MDGKDILPGHREDNPMSCLMFYNSEGDGCGGLIYGNEISEDRDIARSHYLLLINTNKIRLYK